MSRRAVHCRTLGCDKNLVDSEALLGRFAARGIPVAADPESADIWVLNTCGFIEAARRDSYEAIAEMCAAKGGRTLVVTGCLTQEHGEAIARDHPGIDLVNGVGNFDRLLDALELGQDRVPVTRPEDARYEGMADRPLLTPPHLAFLKISEGCNFRCAFCRIPLIRGDQRSRPVAELADEARRLAARGVRELMLVSQNTSDYGRGAGEDLCDLAAALGEVDGLRWLRLHYLYPGLIGLDRFRRLLDLPKVLPYVDMPIQHASPAVLRRMNRPFDAEKLARFFEELRRDRPDLVLRTTLLLGFPGEQEEDVEAVADFLERIRFDHVGTYRYSPEAGTAGADFDDAPDPEEVADREARLTDLQGDIARERQLTRLGQEFDVVVDSVGDGDEWSDLLADLAAGDLEEGDREPGTADPRSLVAGPVAVARSRHFAYDTDGVVLMDGRGLAAGDWLRARFAAVTPFDVLGARAEALGKET
ncbi:MAG: 30S ribosomal protein S12 methylthiotransferase RimO [bacterium]|nr:30S ribosomal protein S12 methylthiotransferase RimO [bacterium]